MIWFMADLSCTLVDSKKDYALILLAPILVLLSNFCLYLMPLKLEEDLYILMNWVHNLAESIRNKVRDRFAINSLREDGRVYEIRFN